MDINNDYMGQIEEMDVHSDDVDKLQETNETEDDIKNISKLNFSELAITGTDWTVETIVNQIKKGNIHLDPSFQRRDAWNNKVKSKFIESLFLGLPIPQIILAENKDKRGQFIVIDGKQRLLSLKKFILPNSDNKSMKLSGLEILSKFNHMTYHDIEEGNYYDDINAFNNQPIRTVVVKKWQDVGALYLLFLRLNTGSIKLSPQELRQALYPGDFVTFANEESTKNEQLRKMLRIRTPDFRMRDVEILIRYYAFYFFAEEYTGSMQDFLDMTCKKLNELYKQSSSEIHSAIHRFNQAVEWTQIVFDNNSFCKFKKNNYERRYNRAIIDIMLFFFSQVEDGNLIKEHSKDIRKSFEHLCGEDEDFISSIETTTKSLTSVHYRFARWGECLSKILGIDLLVPESYKS